MKEFNTTGICIPEKHYMVDISRRIAEIRKLVDSGKYFTINRARQYGKTTTLLALRLNLLDQYDVISLSFQGMGAASFRTEEEFVQSLCRMLQRKGKISGTLPESVEQKLSRIVEQEKAGTKLDEFYDVILAWCDLSEKPLVLMIDEIDSATNNQVFLDFLAQLRDGYLNRDADGSKFFQSVILAGVTDVKHLKRKIRDEDQSKVNSPWNIAADFNIDMSLSKEGITQMLQDYEADHQTGMDTAEIAKLLHDYTNGYPFLVSRLCQLMDSSVDRDSQAWAETGFQEAVKLLLTENNTLFQSLSGKLTNHPDLYDSLRRILMNGERIAYSSDQDQLSEMEMYGFIRNDHGTVRISNRLIETRLYNLFLSDTEMKQNDFYRNGDMDRSLFVQNGQLDVRLILEHFIKTYTEILGPLTDRFSEKDGRELFLLYLKPIINGTGNYYIEAQTRDQKRTDVIIDYLGRQYIIELKIWRGERYNQEGEQQLKDYLDYYGLTTGYMLSFNFNQKKRVGVERVAIDDKVIYEGML